MISVTQATKLAITKMKMKKATLIMSIMISSLLFSLLIACIIIFSGAEKSITSYIEKANNNKYFVKVDPVIPVGTATFSTDLSIDEIKEIKSAEVGYYENIKLKYAELGLNYDSSMEVSALIPAAWKSKSLPEEQRVTINYQSPVITEILKNRYIEYIKSADNTFSFLKDIASSYSATNYYSQTDSLLQGVPILSLIRNGQEDFGDNDLEADDFSVYGYFTNAIHNGSYRFEDDNLIERYIVDKNTSELKGIPVVVSAQEASRLFGEEFNIQDEPENANEKTSWLKNIREKFIGYTYQACYRNSSEQNLLEKIQRDYADINNNEGNVNYLEPSLQYNYPTVLCGDIDVKVDTRTQLEKDNAENLVEVQKILGAYEEPFHKLLTFQIVGVVNAEPYSEYSSSIENYIKNTITIQNRSMEASIPKQMYESLPDNLKYDDIIEKNSSIMQEIFSNELATRIIEFNSMEDARNFLENETCPSSELNCTKKFTGDPYGSNFLILGSIRGLFNKIIKVAVPIALCISLAVMWFTISRIMVESRGETAIYRSMGAKRIDIAIIYFTYTILVTFMTIITALSIGIALAYVINATYGNSLASVAAASFGNISGELNFSLFYLDMHYMFIAATSAIIISMVACVQPIIRNISRPPIEDIRKDN